MKILYVLPHCSTGGMPQYVLKLIQEKIKDCTVEVVEVNNVSNDYTVQRNKIQELVTLHQLNGDQNKLSSLVEGFDIIHFQEIPESFISISILGGLYRKGRKYKIYVTTHSSFTDPTTLRFTADKFILVSNWSRKRFEQVFPGECDIWEYPIEEQDYNKETAKQLLGWEADYKHVLHVGLFTPGKNQKELIEIAELCRLDKIKFHFVGNTAPNFQDHWGPLISSLPDNCVIHGEVSNPEDYYKAADLFYFPSLFELNPLAVKEALSYKLPVMLRKLDTYENTYDGKVQYITDEDKAGALKKALSIKVIDDMAVIVLAHADTEYRKLLLKNCLGTIIQNTILSTNYLVDEETQQLCDYIFYTYENPLLKQEDFAKYNVSYNYWWLDENGTKHYKPFEYEHGYAVYKLIQNGINLAYSLGYKYVAIVNYDYEIGDLKLLDDYSKLKDNDIVAYKQDSTAYEGFTYSTGYFLAEIDSIKPFFNRYKSLPEYYSDGEGFNILEKKFFNYCSSRWLRIYSDDIESLKKFGKVNQEGVLLFSKSNTDKETEPLFLIHYVDGPYLEIKNAGSKRFFVEFIDSDTGKTEHSGHIGNNEWIKATKSYYVNWLIRINGVHYPMSLENERVFISIESSALGDNLAWMPYVEEFRKKHNCIVICSTFKNHLFKDSYPEIEFIEPGEVVNYIVAQYKIGWYYTEGDLPNLFRNPSEFKTIPLQKTAADILGIDYQEIRPKLTLPERNIKRQVAIAIHSTAQAKYWNNPTGWQEVVTHLTNKGYNVILVSKEKDGYMGNNHPKGVFYLADYSLEEVIKTLRESEFFIGIGSGLSWLAWTCEVPTYIISGFSEPYTETVSGTVRIEAPEGACRGCFNRLRLNAGDWNWCPDHKGTDRQFECSRLISASDVISKLPLED